MTTDSSAAIREIDALTVVVEFDKKIYSVAAIKKAAYKFARDFTVLLSDEERNVLARISFASESQDRKELTDAFCAEVLDQDLREQIKNETEATRNLILAHAFSKTTLQQE
jgi:His-Xaa-Ser system protein HxsD